MRLWHYFTNLLRSVFAVSILTGAILFAIAYPLTDAVPDDLAWAAVLITSVSIAVAILKKLRLMLWLFIVLVSYAIGVVYALELLFTPDVADGYRAAVMTISTFVIHGFAAGAFVELVTVLHRVTGRGITALKEKTRLKLEEE